ncbi:type II toxin-antitoxin system antitoxin SocA domain-containing protein [Mucilaginibacter sp.]|uniref:Panacea domain-containing protein n=1 Tax=Mucilaginibacter sp. TaxID=1882438 RepID=UPI003267C869
MYSSHQIANFFIKKSLSTGVELTPMKLLKLCYISHGWHLGLYNTELLNEAIFAWKYGPVINSVYHDFKKYRDGQVSELYVDFMTGTIPLPTEDKAPFLDKIWNIYKGFNGVQLSTMTHQPNTPWDITWNQNGGKNKTSAIIPNDLIKDYYSKRLDAVRVPAVA